MRLLANENVPRAAVLEMRQRGHDVLWIHETAPGLADADVLTRARVEERVLVTFDKDFGELAYRLGLAASPGVVLFRLDMAPEQRSIARLAAILEERDDWVGNFAVVEPGRIRMRPLPAPRMEQ